MKTISMIINNIKNLLPYLLLIAIYFFLVNFEAGKDKKTNRKIENEYIIKDIESSEKNNQQRIPIPVIPYKE